MSKNRIIVFLLFIINTSCQKTNDYYSDINDSEVENVIVTNVKGQLISVSAIKINDSLEISLYVKSTTDNAITLENVDLLVAGLTNMGSVNKELCVGTDGNINFDEFKELKISHEKDVSDKKWIVIYYKFKDPKIFDMDKLDFYVSIKSNLGYVSKNIRMEKHSRYRFVLEGS